MFSFYNPVTNWIIYFPYIITTIEESTEEEENCGDDSREMLSFPWVVFSYSNNSSREFILPYFYFSLFYDVSVALDIAWEVELLHMVSEEKIHPVSQ